MKRLAFALLALLAAHGALADTKISALPAAANIQGTEAVPIVQTSATVRSTPSAIGDYLNNRLNSWVTTNTFSAVVVTGNGTTGGIAGAGALTATSNGQPVTVTGGAAGATSGNGGAVTLTGGAATNGTGGSINLNGANPTTGNNQGGSVTLNGGVGIGNGGGGQVNFNGGSGGTGAATGQGGGISITGGPGGATSGGGGSVSFLGGTATNGNGGDVNVTGRNGVGTNRNGGSVVVTTGTATGSGTAGTFTYNGNPVAVQTTSTGTLSYVNACTTTPTQDYAYVKTGLQVTLTFTTQFACTSDSTAMISDALPAAIRPLRTQVFLATAQNNSGVVPACFAIDSAGVLTWYQVAGAPLQCANSGAWTASGTKGPLTLIGSSPFIASSSAYTYTLN